MVARRDIHPVRFRSSRKLALSSMHYNICPQKDSVMGMRHVSRIEMISMMLPFVASLDHIDVRVKDEKPTGPKRCLLCKSLHNHHNVFCSKECCRAYDAQKKGV